MKRYLFIKGACFLKHDQRGFALEVVQRLRNAGFQALWAGGCVRDFLMGKSPKDYDVATNATPQDVIKLFGHRKTVAVGAAFGVVIVIAPVHEHNVEVATFRNDGQYSDGRRPDQVVFSTAEEDAHRRDFTINGMFYDPISEVVHDYVGGQADLQLGLIRAIGNAHDRIREDKLRMLRAIRFAARLGYQIEAVTSQAVREQAGELLQVSQERITDELSKMLIHHARGAALYLCHQHGLLEKILEKLPLKTDWVLQLEYVQQITQQLPTGHLMLAWTIFFEALLKPEHTSTLHVFVGKLARHFKMSNDQHEEIAWLWANQYALERGKDCSLAELKTVLGHPHAQELLAWMELRAARGELSSQVVIFCQEYVHNTPREIMHPLPLLTGIDLIRLGMKPGPEFKAMLDKVRIAQLNEDIHTQAEAIRLIGL